MSIRYVLRLEVYDTSRTPFESWKPIYQDEAEMHVTSLKSISDRQAFGTLVPILMNALVPEGSTVLARQELNSVPVSE